PEIDVSGAGAAGGPGRLLPGCDDVNGLPVVGLRRSRGFECQLPFQQYAQASDVSLDDAPAHAGTLQVLDALIPAVVLRRQAQLLVNRSADILALEHDHPGVRSLWRSGLQ